MFNNCRVCLTQDVEHMFISFDFQFQLNFSVFECYRLFTLIPLENQIERDKSKICPDCLNKLSMFYDYRCQAITNNEVMKNWKNNGEDVKDGILSSLAMDPLFPKIKMELMDSEYPEYPDFPEASTSGIPEVQHIIHEDLPTSSLIDLYSVKEEMEEEARAKARAARESLYSPDSQPKRRKKRRTKKEKDLDIDPLPKRVLCQLCGKDYPRDDIKRHTDRVHLKIKRIVCDMCGLLFYGKRDLRDHLMKHLNRADFPCTDCGKCFTSSFTLNNHRYIHHTERPFINCDVPGCTSKFKRQGCLNQHVKLVHMKVRHWRCEQCGQGFVSQQQLVDHGATIHSNEANFACTLCSNRYKTAKRLEGHMIYHEEPKFTCSFCGKKYVHPKTLKHHEKTQHLNIRDHHCSHCPKQFYTNVDLQRHIKSVHLKLRVRCDHCSSEFSRKDKYSKHVRVHHQNIGPENMEALLDKIRNMRVDLQNMTYV